jgi:hypothetical protein
VRAIIAAYADNKDPQRDRCWIAEIDGDNISCVFRSRIRMRSRELRPAERTLGPYTVAPLAFGRRKCSSSRGMISTKLHGP